MWLGVLWRACLAVLIGLAFGYLALNFIRDADRADRMSAPTAHSPGATSGTSRFLPRLTLVHQATTGFLISLQVGPFEVGQNQVRVTLLNPLGKPQQLDSAHLRLSRLESSEILSGVDAKGSGPSKTTSVQLDTTGWWQIDVTANVDSEVTFYTKLDKPSGAPTTFPPPDYPGNPQAQALFQSALARYESLNGMKWVQELTSGNGGPNGLGVWFVTNINASREGYHATTLNPEQGGSELYSDTARQCFRQVRENWQCSEGAPPIGPFDLAYMKSATGFTMGREEVIDGEMTQVIFFYNPSQSAWYAWWIGEETGYLRRQAMVANSHFMLDRFSEHDVPQQIRPKDLPPS
jgi:hypothetical protein